jgi:FixJ family two-component response regulator
MTASTLPAALVVHVVEDDESSRAASVRLLRTAGFPVQAYASGAEFLARLPEGPGCVVLDLELPGGTGLDVQQRLAASPNPMPVVFLTGHGDVPKSVHAMKAGAVDFLTKPVEAVTLLDAVARAVAADVLDRERRERRQTLQLRYDRLTPREREVFAHLISGQLNKQVGFDLGIAERTIKIHRQHLLAKMEAGSIAELVRMAADLGIAPAGSA